MDYFDLRIGNMVEGSERAHRVLLGAQVTDDAYPESALDGVLPQRGR